MYILVLLWLVLGFISACIFTVGAAKLGKSLNIMEFFGFGLSNVIFGPIALATILILFSDTFKTIIIIKGDD